VNGKSLVYLENTQDLTVTNAGQVILVKCANITVKNLDLSNASVGVELWGSERIRIENVIASNNSGGLGLFYSGNNTITNVSANNNYYGIYLYSSGNNTIKDSVLKNNGLVVWRSYNNNVTNTTVNGKPLVYLENTQDRTVTDAGQVILVNCRNVTVKDLDLSNASVGVELWGSEWIRIENVIASNNSGGLVLFSSRNNTITNVTANNNYDAGILLFSSGNNTITNVTANNNYDEGILLFSSNNNTINGSVLQNNGRGIVLVSSGNNLIYNNYFNNTNNVTIYDSQPNTWNVTKTGGKNIVGGNYLAATTGEAPTATGSAMFARTATAMEYATSHLPSVATTPTTCLWRRLQ